MGVEQPGQTVLVRGVEEAYVVVQEAVLVRHIGFRGGGATPAAARGEQGCAEYRQEQPDEPPP